MTAVVCVSSGENSHLMLHLAIHWNEWHLIWLQLEILTDPIMVRIAMEKDRKMVKREKNQREA